MSQAWPATNLVRRQTRGGPTTSLVQDDRRLGQLSNPTGMTVVCLRMFYQWKTRSGVWCWFLTKCLYIGRRTMSVYGTTPKETHHIEQRGYSGSVSYKHIANVRQPIWWKISKCRLQHGIWRQYRGHAKCISRTREESSGPIMRDTNIMYPWKAQHCGVCMSGTGPDGACGRLERETIIFR